MIDGIELSSVAQMGDIELCCSITGELPEEIFFEDIFIADPAHESVRARRVILPRQTRGVRVTDGERAILVAQTPAGNWVRFLKVPKLWQRDEPETTPEDIIRPGSEPPKGVDPREYYRASLLNDVIEGVDELEEAIKARSLGLLDLSGRLACIGFERPFPHWPAISLRCDISASEVDIRVSHTATVFLFPEKTVGIRREPKVEQTMQYFAQGSNGRFLHLVAYCGKEKGPPQPPLPGVLDRSVFTCLFARRPGEIFPYLGAVDITPEILGVRKLLEEANE